jgi:enoyl-CoA hydratase/carnithine racemase
MLIELEQKERVLRVTLNRPEKRNALNVELCENLIHAFEQGDQSADVGAILVTANGPAFCAGMDLRESLAADSMQLAGLHERLFTTINRIRKPVVAAVQGPAIAGGTGLVANAHIAVAAPGATFGLTEVRIGLWPVLVFRAVELAMGERRATELSLTGRTFGAEEAMRYGLVNEIAGDYLARATAIAVTISHYSPIAVGRGLDYVHRIRVRDWDHAGRIGHQTRDQLLASEDYREGVRAFLEKRQPSWPSLKEAKLE